ncbi:MAG TPA: hypothetical protein VL361_09955, partial [Candidatus Limnocylindrales bacterium]|nr:hypothetical protein [Candidatus Limnocylindrales bacterium]
MKPRNKKAARVETEAARNQTSEASLPQQSSHVKGNGNGHLSDALARAKLLELLAKVGSKSVTFNRAYAELGAGIPGAILITQCVFWSQCKSNSSRKGYFYKTLEDWTDETALSRYQIESARRFFVE